MPGWNTSSKEIANAMISQLITFFKDVNHEKGFVFTHQERIKLIKEEEKKKKKDKAYLVVPWTQESTWNEEKQRHKLAIIFESHELGLRNELETELKEIFINVSYIFADETSSELYHMLFEILRIAVEEENEKQRIEVKKFMSKVGRGERNFRFFGYNFSNAFKLNLGEE